MAICYNFFNKLDLPGFKEKDCISVFYKTTLIIKLSLEDILNCIENELVI